MFHLKRKKLSNRVTDSVSRVRFEHALEQDGHHYRAEQDQHDDPGEIFRSDKAYRKAGFCSDEGDLASCHHADTDLERVIEVEFAKLRNSAAAYYLGKACNSHKCEREEQKL